ncbi:MAG: roadblock/LC7 domain-containing protein [Candidatus Hodarchaeota archaeon]
MDSLKIEKTSKELDKLESIAGIIGTAIVNRNGLTILSRLPRQIEERKFGAMAATMFGAMETVSAALNDKLLNLSVEFENSQLIILGGDDNIIVVALIEYNIDLGLIFIEIEESIKNIQELLKGD